MIGHGCVPGTPVGTLSGSRPHAGTSTGFLGAVFEPGRGTVCGWIPARLGTTAGERSSRAKQPMSHLLDRLSPSSQLSASPVILPPFLRGLMALLPPVLRNRPSHQRSRSILSGPGAHESLGDISIAVRAPMQLPLRTRATWTLHTQTGDSVRRRVLPGFGEFQRGLEIRNGARGLSGASSAAGVPWQQRRSTEPGERQPVGRFVTTVRTAVSLPVR
jgi:hypothetical protein